MRRLALLLALIPSVVFAAASQQFNGSSGYMACGTTTSANYTTSVTAACWVKTTGTQGLFFTRDDQSTERQWYMQHNSGRFYVNIFSCDSGGGVCNKNYNVAVTNIAKWHHYLFTFTNNTLNLYIDGVLQTPTKTFDATVTTLQSTAEKVQIGRNTAGNYHGGAIADCRIYDRVLTQSEISTLASKKMNGLNRNLVFWQPLMQENGTSLFSDRSSSGVEDCTQSGTVTQNASDGPGLYL